MASDWPVTTVGNVTERVTKGTTPTTLGFGFQDDGISFVKVESISEDGVILRDKLAYISENADAALARSKLQPDDVLFTIAGTIGRVALVPEALLPANTNQAVAVVRPRKDLVLPNFLRYVLCDKTFLRHAASRVVQGVQANFSLRELKAARIWLPSMPEQRGICGVLGSLHDRIENLRQTNATLEAIAQALFKSWFVDFDPVRAKAEGREPDGMDAATTALFPSEFEYSELGPIPAGWRVGGSDNFLDIVGGGTPKTSIDEYWGGEIPWFSVVDAPAPGQVFTLDTAKKITEIGLQNCSSKLLPPMTTIISARGTVGKLAMTGVPMAMNQSCYALRSKVQGGEAFVYFFTLRFVEQLRRIAHGAVFDTITRDSFKRINTCQAPAEAIVAFGEAANPLLARIRLNGQQAATLREIRDSLLPRLISGKLRLPEAEREVEAVTA